MNFSCLFLTEIKVDFCVKSTRFQCFYFVDNDKHFFVNTGEPVHEDQDLGWLLLLRQWTASQPASTCLQLCQHGIGHDRCYKVIIIFMKAIPTELNVFFHVLFSSHHYPLWWLPYCVPQSLFILAFSIHGSYSNVG